ncbi:MAG: hypothetical protein RLP12_00895 [Ekhidna sp.]
MSGQLIARKPSNNRLQRTAAEPERHVPMRILQVKWYWLSYFVLILVVGYGQMLRKILTDTGGFSSRYSAALVATGIVFILIAKARGIPLWRAWLWKVVFILLTLLCILGLVFSIYLAVIGVYFSAVLLICGAILLAPALLQIYMYSYRSPEIWIAAHNNQINQGQG